MTIKDVLFALLIGCILAAIGSLICIYGWGHDITTVGYALMLIGLGLIVGAAAQAREIVQGK